MQSTTHNGQPKVTNLSQSYRKAANSVGLLIDILATLEGQLIQLPDNWLLLTIDTPKGSVLSQIVFPQGKKAINKASLREWIIHEINRTALTQTCYYCDEAFQPRASNSQRLYMWCAKCGFSCFNWLQK